MTNIAKLKKDEAKYVEQIKWLEKMSKKLQDNLFNVRAKMQEVSNEQNKNTKTLAVSQRQEAVGFNRII